MKDKKVKHQYWHTDIIYTHTSVTVIYSCIYDHLQEFNQYRWISEKQLVG